VKSNRPDDADEVVSIAPGMVSQPPTRRRRSGLGRRLAELIESEDSGPDPTHFRWSPPTPVAVDEYEVGRVTVIESGELVHVEVEGTDGSMAVAPVLGAVDDAVLAATSELLDIDAGWDISVATAETSHGDVVVVTARDLAGARVAAAACIEFGRPWAIARALADLARS
jgi:hypothetical protein